MDAEPADWYRSAVTYQLYIRSFADSDGDGLGDIGGVRSRLLYLAALGADAVWITPWYPSPQVDGGYDVADHRDVYALIQEAHEAGLKVLLDIVPNHTSDEHSWFRAARAAPGSAEVESSARLRPERLHTAFAFEFMRARWHAKELRESARAALEAHDSVGAPVTWTLSNHDVTRHVTRLGRPQERTGDADPQEWPEGRTDLLLGTRRARAAILYVLALPGGVYLYQGEELGLPEVEDLPEALLQDPAWERSGHTQRGRDGCRVPIPWTRGGPSLGFGDAAGWLPQPAGWGDLSVEAEESDPGSMLSLYREALRLRRELPQLGVGGGRLVWTGEEDEVLGLTRGAGFICMLNTGAVAVRLPPGRVVLSSSPTRGDLLPPDAAAWIVTG